jgi:aryl-alcohol dehydrogenase-like predicted oxidoreductase
MRYRKFGKTELLVSEIGFGAWAIGGNSVIGNTPIGWGPADDKTSVLAIEKALDSGINFFDTADFYGLGHSETLLGKSVKNKKAIIATKVGQKVIGNSIASDYSKNYIIQACEASLGRLERDVIDYYQLHNARMEHLLKGECVEAMELLKTQGKIRYWGLSLNTFNPEPEGNYFIDNYLGDGLQLVFNLINQKASEIMLSAAKKEYGIIARMPLQFGLLTGKFSGEYNFSDDDHRKFRLTKEIITKSNTILSEKVWGLCSKYNISKISLALSFVLSFKAVNTVIPGIRTAQHVIDNSSGIIQLNKEDVNYLTDLYNTHWKGVLGLMEKQG